MMLCIGLEKILPGITDKIIIPPITNIDFRVIYKLIYNVAQ